jgi:hypothetical protein
MIRREMKFADGKVQWLLVSQVEHARISGLLARHWGTNELSPYEFEGLRLPAEVTQEIIAAVTHHDDGWGRWEATPGLDPERGRPYTFINELPLEESLAIWDDSIAAARQFGPLAGWMVASHFFELLHGSDHADDSRTKWLEQTDKQRAEWLQQWQQAGQLPTPGIAERALRLLQACDVLSLWLFCDCPVLPQDAAHGCTSANVRWPERRAPADASSPPNTRRTKRSNTPVAHPGWFISGTPWPFGHSHLELAAAAWLVPVQRYDTSQELLAARRPVHFGWSLQAHP